MFNSQEALYIITLVIIYINILIKFHFLCGPGWAGEDHMWCWEWNPVLTHCTFSLIQSGVKIIMHITCTYCTILEKLPDKGQHC